MHLFYLKEIFLSKVEKKSNLNGLWFYKHGKKNKSMAYLTREKNKIYTKSILNGLFKC